MSNLEKPSTKQNGLQQQKPNEVSLPDNYAVMSNVYSQIIAALSNLRDRCYDVLDASYEIGHILNDHPEYMDTLLDRIVNVYHGVEYGFHRYNLAIPKEAPDEMLEDAMTGFYQSIDAIIMTSDPVEYKEACEKVQKSGDGVISLVAFKLKDYQNKLKGLEIDIQVGPHSDTMADLFPDRFESVIASSESNRKALSIKIAQKANDLNTTIQGMGKIEKALRDSKNIIDIFQSKQSVLLKQIEMFTERNDREKVIQLKAQLKQLTNDFFSKIDSDWMNVQSIWATIDIPTSPINDIDADNARHIRKILMSALPERTESILAAYRDIRKWVDALLVALINAKRSGGLPDKRSKWYIGNKSIVEEFNEFKKEVELTIVNNGSSSKQDHDNTIIFVAVRLIEYIKSLTKYITRELALDLGRGDKYVRESLLKAGLIWNQIEALHSSYKKSAEGTPDIKTFEKLFGMYSDMFTRLNRASTDEDRFAEIKRMADLTPQLISQLEGGRLDIRNLSDNFDPTYMTLLQTQWNDLARKYGEMLQLVPNNAFMQLNHIMNDVPEPGRMFSKRIDSWLRTIINLIDKVIEFAVFYIRIKSLYPMTIGMRTNVEPGIDYRGRSVENIKYVESMGALLHEALSGKSLSASKTALLRQASDLYQDDPKVQNANKMYDLIMKGY